MAHRHAERDGAPVARELLDRARYEGVTLLDVDGLGELLLAEVDAAAGEAREVGVRRDAEAAQGAEEAVADHLRERARVDDLLEDVVEALAVAARGRRREAEERAGPRGVERAELPQDAEVVLGGGVVALVVDDEAEIAAGDDAREALFVQRSDRGDEDVRALRRALRAALDGDDAIGGGERALEFLARLRDELLAVREHEDLLLRQARELGEDHRLAGARR